MKILERNKTVFYYALFAGKEMVRSDAGYLTGEPIETYGKPVKARASISAANGVTAMEVFGNYNDYSKVILSDDMSLPIKENSALWVDVLPTIKQDGTTNTPNDYIVVRISKTLNVIAYAIAKVNKQV